MIYIWKAPPGTNAAGGVKGAKFSLIDSEKNFELHLADQQAWFFKYLLDRSKWLSNFEIIENDDRVDVGNHRPPQLARAISMALEAAGVIPATDEKERKQTWRVGSQAPQLSFERRHGECRIVHQGLREVKLEEEPSQEETRAIIPEGAGQCRDYIRMTRMAINHLVSSNTFPSLKGDPWAYENALDLAVMFNLPLATVETLKCKEYVDFAAAFKDLGGNVILLGDAGAGKTNTVLNHALQALDGRLSDNSLPLPVYINLGKVDSEWPFPKMAIACTQEEFHTVVSSAKSPLYIFDGLDEIKIDASEYQDKQQARIKKQFGLLQRIRQELNGRPFIITCRSYDYSLLPNNLFPGHVVTLKPFEINQVRSILQSRGQDNLFEEIQADSNLMELAGNPLLLYLMSVTRTYDPSGSLKISHSTTPADIFNDFIEARLRHEAGRAALPFPGEEIREQLGNLASYRLTQLDEFIAGQSPDYWDRLLNCAETLNLVRRGTTGGFEFMHAKLQDFCALPQLVKAMEHPDEVVRWRSASALGSIQSIEAVPALLRALKDPDDIVCWKAAVALGEIRDPRAIEPLIQIMNGERSLDIAVSTWRAILQIGAPPIAPNDLERVIASFERGEYTGQCLAACRLVQYLDNELVLDAAIRALHGDSLNLSVIATGMLGLCAQHLRATEALRSVLDNPEPNIAGSAATFLLPGGDKKAVDVLMRMLATESPDIRWRVGEGLHYVQHPDALPTLLKLAADVDHGVRFRALTALGDYSDLRATAALRKASQSDPNEKVRSMAQYVLDKLKW